MKRITLRAEESLIEAVRARARAEGTTLNALFRLWLAEYAGRESRADLARSAIEDLQGRLKSGGKRFTRSEMNER